MTDDLPTDPNPLDLAEYIEMLRAECLPKQLTVHLSIVPGAGFRVWSPISMTSGQALTGYHYDPEAAVLEALRVLREEE